MLAIFLIHLTGLGLFRGDDGTVDCAVRVPGDSTARVTLEPGTPVLGPDGQPVPLLPLTRVGVR